MQCIEADEWMMRVLRHAQALHLPQWQVCAGFVRSKVWDELHGFTKRTPLSDVDVIYYDPGQVSEEAEKQLEQQLWQRDEQIPWSVKNQARMHLVNQIPPYRSVEDAISKFPETATALGVSLDGQDRVILMAPWGIADLLQMRVRPTPYFAASEESMRVYRERLARKQWTRIWHCLKVDDEGEEGP